MSHTPTPWDLYNTEDCLVSIPHTKGKFLLRVMAPESEIGDQEDYDNAAYIVQAVNSYQAMKEALIEAHYIITQVLTDSQLDERTTCGLFIRDYIVKVEKALTLANGAGE